MTVERSTRLTLWLAMACLVLPFIWIKIGPNGHAFYGPDVPDIYILGATILGKDRSFWGIAFAVWFQLAMGLGFIGLAYGVNRGRYSLAWVQLVLLLLFPVWMKLYVDGVICNSDGAASDLQVYPHVGMAVYLVLLGLVIHTLVRSQGRRNRAASPSGPQARTLRDERQARRSP